MSGASTTSTRRGAGSSAAARAAAAAAASASASASSAGAAGSPAEAASGAAVPAAAPSKGKAGSPGLQEQQTHTQPAAAIPAATLQRLGIVGLGAGGSSTTGPHSTPSSPRSPVPSTPSSSSPPPLDQQQQQLLLPDHAGNPTGLVTLKAQLEHARETAALRSETVANYRAHLLAAPVRVASRRASSAASTSTSSRRNNGPSTSKLSPPLPTSSGPTPSVPPTSSTLPAPSSSSRSRQPTPPHASNLSSNNANNALPATSSSLAAPRGTKRARADSASDSSLSPQSATSNSSIEPLAAKRKNDPSSHHVNGTTSRQGSPTSTSASGNVLGLSSAKLSRTAASSSQSQQSKDSNAGPTTSSKDATAAASPALSSSTSSSTAAASTAKDAAPAAKPPGSKDALAAIAGLGAPLPSLPGFTRKKKQQPQDKQASPAPVPRQASPPTDHSQHPSTSASSSSTSRLPPPPSSLPPRPPSLPPKPSTSYGSSTSHYRRESSTTGSTSGWERDRDNRDARDRDNTSRRGSERDTRDTDRERERERERARERDRDKDRERERERDRDRDRDTRHRREGSTASTSRGRDSDTWLHNRSKDNSPVDEKRAAVSQDRQSPSTSTSMSNVSIGNVSIPEVRIVEDTPSAIPSPIPSTIAESPTSSEVSAVPEPPPSPPRISGYRKTVPKPVAEVEESPDQPPAPPEEDAPPPPPPLPIDEETKSEQPNTKEETTVSDAARQPSAEPASQPLAPLRPRKTLPPPTTAATAAASSSSAAPSPKPIPPALAPRAAAIAADANAPVARPTTPLGRKTLPASVTAAASRRGSPAPSALDKTKLSVTGGTGTQGAGTANTGAEVNGQHRPSQLNSDGSTADPEATALAKQKRKEERKKRKLAALMDGGGGTPGTSPIQANGQALPFPNGSPAIKINGLTPSASMTRTDSNAPTKMRRIDSTTSMESSEKGGLKVRLGGITINRPKSLSPADGNQPAVKKGPSVPGIADDFSLPTRSLVPAAPPLQIPTPTPSKQSEINEDLDNSKPATQVPYSSFANWYNDFLRSFGDDDLAFLAPKPEDSSIYDVPPLGPHYHDTWATMDAELNGEQTDGPQPSTALLPPALRRFKTSNLSDADLAAENVYLGPLGERLVSAFRHTRDIQKVMEELFNSSQQNAIDLDKSGLDIEAPDSARVHPDGIANKESQPIASDFANPLQTSPQFFSPAAFSDPAVLASTPSVKEMDAVDFESRLIRELSFLGVIPLPTRQAPVMTKPTKKGADNALSTLDLSSSVDWATRADDEISTALRACQRQLGKQSELNNKRKERLISIVRQRMAYQEYEHLRDGLEAVIEGAWAKRQRAAQRKAQKDRKDKDKKGDREKDKDKLEAASLAQSIAALNTPQPHSASLIAALTKRRSLLDNFRHLFPSNSYILPQESIYADLAKDAHS